MTKHTTRRPGVAAGVVGLLLLAGCSSTAPGPEPAGPSADDDDALAARFVACLTAAGVDARISDLSGMVMVRDAVEPGEDGSVSQGSGTGSGSGEAPLLSEGDEAGNHWVAAQSSAYFADDPDTQDAYASCEAEHPDFAQPAFDAEAEQDAYADQQAQDGLAFARCARDAGFTWVADPVVEEGTSAAIALPADVTEEEFRSLLEACWDPALGLVWSVEDELGFDWFAVLDELVQGGSTSSSVGGADT